MRLNPTRFIRTIALCALLLAANSTSHAATILKLTLGGVGPDVGMNGAGILSTIPEDITTLGDQNTTVDFTSFLSFIPDITTNTASFSLRNLAEVGPAQVLNAGTLVIQNFQGGTFELYDPANTLLLSGAVQSSVLSGVIGPPGTGALFTTTLNNFTAGTLTPFLSQGTVSLSMNMTNVNGGAGFQVAGGGPALNPFLADASVDIAATPEPGTLTLVALGAAGAFAGARRRRA